MSVTVLQAHAQKAFSAITLLVAMSVSVEKDIRKVMTLVDAKVTQDHSYY